MDALRFLEKAADGAGSAPELDRAPGLTARQLARGPVMGAMERTMAAVA